MTRLSRWKSAVLATAAFAAVTFNPVTASAVESSDPIKIALFDWTSVNINARILGGILEKLGYTVEYPTGDYLSSLTTSLTNGDVTIGVEYWDTTAGEAMAASEATGQTERLGMLGPKAKEEWWYPLYMKEKCPGLPNWEALKDPKCAEAFSTPETAPKGRYVGGPVTWEGFDDERVEALGLPFTVMHADVDAVKLAELDSAYQRKAPVMVWVYSPHWAPAKYEGEWVEFPPYSKECYEDPKVGVNPDKAYDCGKPFGDIWKFAWGGMKDKWPVAHKVAKAYQIDVNELNAMSGQVDLDGKTIEEVAAAWVDANEAKWKAWAQ